MKYYLMSEKEWRYARKLCASYAHTTALAELILRILSRMEWITRARISDPIICEACGDREADDYHDHRFLCDKCAGG